MAENVAENRLHQSRTESLTSILRQNHDVWVKNNLPRSRGTTGPILVNMKEPEGEFFAVEIAPGKATNLSIQASDKAMETSTELRRLIHNGDVIVLSAEQVGNLTDAEIHVPGDYLENPHYLRPNKNPAGTVINPHIDTIHPRLTGMAREYEVLMESLENNATIDQIHVDRIMDELLGLSDLLRMEDFDFIKQVFTHPTILDWVERYLRVNTPRP